MAQTFLMGAISNALFYPFMFMGILFLFSPENWNSSSMKKFRCLYLLMGIYLIYAFTIGLAYLNEKNIFYLGAKLSTFGIIIISINHNEEFYRHKCLKILIIFMAFFLGYGLLTGGGGTISTGRQLAGYTNANTASTMGATLIGILLFYLRDKKWAIFYYILLLLGFYGILAGGSRAGFLMLGLLIFLRYGINIKTVLFGSAIIVFGIYVLPALGIHTVGIERMMDTYNGIEGTNRDAERVAGEWMIAQRPLTGWGFNVVNVGYAAKLTPLPSHNGYIEVAKQMGIPFAILYFIVIIMPLISTAIKKIKFHKPMDLFYALSLVMLIQANYESYYIGVHEFSTNLFFFALAMIGSNNYFSRHQLNRIQLSK